MVFDIIFRGIFFFFFIVVKFGELVLENFDWVLYFFDRKEVKDYGEGGNIVGVFFKGKKIFIVDDVIIVGIVKREVIDKICKEGGIVVGIVVVFDCMEKLFVVDGDDLKFVLSVIGEFCKEFGILILSILMLDDIIEGLKGVVLVEDIKWIEVYCSIYKVLD